MNHARDRHQRMADEADMKLAGMTAMEALHAGLVQRTRPYFVCAERSPDTSTLCSLEPGHESGHGHQGNDRGTQVVWS